MQSNKHLRTFPIDHLRTFPIDSGNQEKQKVLSFEIDVKFIFYY